MTIDRIDIDFSEVRNIRRPFLRRGCHNTVMLALHLPESMRHSVCGCVEFFLSSKKSHCIPFDRNPNAAYIENGVVYVLLPCCVTEFHSMRLRVGAAGSTSEVDQMAYTKQTPLFIFEL